jgi:hypothetical protein
MVELASNLQQACRAIATPQRGGLREASVAFCRAALCACARVWRAEPLLRARQSPDSSA